jgi:hypothetical protein
MPQRLATLNKLKPLLKPGYYAHIKFFMKRNFFGIIFLMITTISLASPSAKRTPVTIPFSCTTITVTLSCNAQFLYCMGEGIEGLLAYHQMYNHMNSVYCNEGFPPPQP